MNYDLLDINKPLEGRTQYPWSKPAMFFLFIVFYLNALSADWERNILFVLAIIFITLGRILKRKWYSQDDIIGKMHLDELQVTINNQQVFLLDDITHIKLASNGYWSKSIEWIRNDKILNGATEIEIQYKNGRSYEYRFVIDSEQHYSSLKDFLVKCYRKNISISETVGDKNKAFLLKSVSEMTYAEIQKIKKKLKISN